MLRIQFNREVAYYAREIVWDVEAGRKNTQEGLRAIQEEQANLLGQSTKILQQSVGLAAGALQVISGAAMCAGTLGFACGVGVLMTAHGAKEGVLPFVGTLDNTIIGWLSLATVLAYALSFPAEQDRKRWYSR
jgi:hypothetical protein